MSQNAVGCKLKKVIGGGKSYESQTKFLEFNLSRMVNLLCKFVAEWQLHSS
jgi:hypothetical protein